MTITDLTTGTVINYTDMANDSDYVVLDTYTDDFGTWVNVINKETNHIEPKSASTEIGNRWTIVKAA
jgi:hypothetical protein